MKIEYKKVESSPTRFVEILPSVLMNSSGQPCALGLMVIDSESKEALVCPLRDSNAVAAFLLALTTAAALAFSTEEMDAAMEAIAKDNSTSEASAKGLLN